MQTTARQTEPSVTSFSAAEPKLIPVNPEQIGEVLRLGAVVGLLGDVVRRHEGELSIKGIVDRLAKREWILWLVWNGDVQAILATELYFDVGGAKRCRIPFCTGDGARGWVHLLDEIEAWAREEGCTKLDMIARKGWAKHLPDYRMTHVVLEKDLRA